MKFMGLELMIFESKFNDWSIKLYLSGLNQVLFYFMRITLHYFILWNT